MAKQVTKSLTFRFFYYTGESDDLCVNVIASYTGRVFS
jgi:hypothetical protein